MLSVQLDSIPNAGKIWNNVTPWEKLRKERKKKTTFTNNKFGNNSSSQFGTHATFLDFFFFLNRGSSENQQKEVNCNNNFRITIRNKTKENIWG